MSMNIGNRVDDLVLVRPDGTDVSLGEFAGKPLIVVVLRHLA